MTELIEETGDIWEYYQYGAMIVVTTNGIVRKDGACVMGAGVAKQAAKKFPQLPFEVGRHLGRYGNVVGVFHRIITMPVKHHWRDEADLDLIAASARDLCRIVTILNAHVGAPRNIVSVRPGCGNGGLNWETVKPIVAPWFIHAGITIVNL
jgi:hypothetical protein